MTRLRAVPIGLAGTLILLLGMGSLAAGQSKDLTEAMKQLRGGSEPEVRTGAQLLRAINNVKAIEALLDVLKQTQPHYRDIVWEELPNFTDPGARKRVEEELRSNRKNDDVREWCVELLGIYGDGSFGKSVLVALGDNAVEVKRAAARSLGQLRYEPACTKLEAAAKDKDIYLRANALEALARIKPGDYESLFLKGLEDTDAGVRCALLGILPQVVPGETEARSAAALKDTDWRPRMQGVENLSFIRTKTSVDALVTASGDTRPVVRLKAIRALQKITGQKWTDQRQWADWWRDNRESFDLAEGTKEADGQSEKAPDPDEKYGKVQYNSLPVVSDHVAFLIDKSKDMQKTRKSDGRVKSDVALAELSATLSRLSGQLEFNVYTYSDEVTAFRKHPVKLEEKERKAAAAFVSAAPENGDKNIWNALATVVNDSTLDTLYLISSGEPEVGLYVHWNRVTAHLKDLNRFHKVVIHTVVYSDSKWYRDQLEKIAEVTGGRFIWTD